MTARIRRSSTGSSTNTGRSSSGRVVNVHALVATGINTDGHREIVDLDVTSAEDGAGWSALLRGLTHHGLTGVALVTSDAHAGLVAAFTATLPGAAWRRAARRMSRRRRYLEIDVLARAQPSPPPSTWR